MTHVVRVVASPEAMGAIHVLRLSLGCVFVILIYQWLSINNLRQRIEALEGDDTTIVM